MTELIPAQLGKIIHGISVRQVRLACGFVLFAYLVSHFVNHALGNISLGAMAKGIEYHKAFWQFLPVAIVFYSAATVHTAWVSGRFTSGGNFAGKRSSRYSLPSA